MKDEDFVIFEGKRIPINIIKKCLDKAIDDWIKRHTTTEYRESENE